MGPENALSLQRKGTRQDSGQDWNIIRVAAMQLGDSGRNSCSPDLQRNHGMFATKVPEFVLRKLVWVQDQPEHGNIVPWHA